MTPTPLKALVFVALIATLPGTPADAARQQHRNIPFSADPHAVGMSVYTPQIVRGGYSKSIRAARSHKRKSFVPRSARRSGVVRSVARYHRGVGHRVARKVAPRTAQSQVHSWGAPSRFIGGRLICAVNVNAALAARGIRGTGSRLAKSFLGWGRSSGPVPGAVAVFNRGRNPRSGHVAIVKEVKPDGRVVFWNPSSRRGWVEGTYNKRPIAYRVASAG